MAAARIPHTYHSTASGPAPGEPGTDPHLLQQWGEYTISFVTWHGAGYPASTQTTMWDIRLDVSSRTVYYSIPQGMDAAKVRQDVIAFATGAFDLTAARAQQVVDHALHVGGTTDGTVTPPVSGEAYKFQVLERFRLSSLTSEIGQKTDPVVKGSFGTPTVTWSEWTVTFSVPTAKVVRDNGSSISELRADAAGSAEFTRGENTYVRDDTYAQSMRDLFADLGLGQPDATAQHPSGFTGRGGTDCGPVGAK